MYASMDFYDLSIDKCMLPIRIRNCMGRKKRIAIARNRDRERHFIHTNSMFIHTKTVCIKLTIFDSVQMIREKDREKEKERQKREDSEKKRRKDERDRTGKYPLISCLSHKDRRGIG